MRTRQTIAAERMLAAQGVRVKINKASHWTTSREWCMRQGLDPERMWAYELHESNMIWLPTQAFITLPALVSAALDVETDLGIGA